jgi:hypothetical protein
VAKQKSTIHDLKLDEISLVDKAANRECTVDIWKRDDTEVSASDLFVRTIRKALLSIPDLDTDVISKIDDAMDEAATILKAETPMAGACDEDGNELLPDGTKKPVKKSDTENEEVDVTKSDAYVGLQKRLESAEETIAEFQKRERTTEIRKRLEDAGVLADVQKAAEQLEGLPKETAEFFEAQLVSTAAIAKKAGLFEQLGSGANARPNSAAAEMDTKVEKRMKDIPGETPEMAYAAIYKTDVDLRKRLREEGV